MHDGHHFYWFAGKEMPAGMAPFWQNSTKKEQFC